MSFALDLQARFRNHLEAEGLFPVGTRVVVGYSGGADSTCLVHLLHQAGVDVFAAHLNHLQRPEAEKEVGLLEALCAEWGVPFLAGRADVPQLSEDRGIGIEEAGRLARYAFLAQAKGAAQAHLIATAHTRTDHIETVLLNAVRGTGLAGLGGIPARRGDVIRPLLSFTREETHRYCTELGLFTLEDPGNSDLSFSRARIRHRVLPELEKINPAVGDALTRLAKLADEEDAFLNGMAAASLEQAEIPLNGDLRFLTLDVEVAFESGKLGHLPKVLVRRAIRLAARVLGGEFDFDQTHLILDGLSSQSSGSVTCEGGQVVAEFDSERLHLRQLSPALPFRHNLTVPGETWSEEFGWQIVAAEAPKGQDPIRRRGLNAEFELSAIKGQLYFRTAQPGDEIQPLGFSGRRKVADLMAESRLTLTARRRMPMVCDMLGILWVPGVCLSERARPLAESERTLHLLFGPYEGTQSPRIETGQEGGA